MVQVEERSLQAVIAMSIAALTSYLNAVIVPITVLMIAMIIDYITGMVSAWHKSELSSQKGVFGIVKKVSYLALVCVGMGVDWLIYSGLSQVGVTTPYTVFFGVLVTIWLIINELISILENLKNIGVPLPKFLVTVVNRLKVSTENKFKGDDKEDD